MHSSLDNPRRKIDSGLDSIVIKTNLHMLKDGSLLDTTGFRPDVIDAGHIIIRETRTGNYKPMPVNDRATAYAPLPAGHTYFGIQAYSTDTVYPYAAILLIGTVNHKATAIPMDDILADLRAALPNIMFRAD